MDSIPADIVLDKLPGPVRGEHPTIYFRDEIVWSPSKKHFALAYTITEASMNNDIGCVLWASFDVGRSVILRNPAGLHACCWYSPWCVWLDDETFVFKAQRYDGRTVHVPLVVVHLHKGVAVIPGTNRTSARPSQAVGFRGKFQPMSDEEVLKAIERSAKSTDERESTSG